jgi:hypothetical protein
MEANAFGRVERYLQAVAAANPGTIVHVQRETGLEGTATAPRRYFLYATLVLGQVRSVLPHIRPIVFGDGAHLRGYFGGNLLAVVGKDALGRCVPLVLVVHPQESLDAWTVAARALVEAFPGGALAEMNELTDGDKGLDGVVLASAPGYPVRPRLMCCRHLALAVYRKPGTGSREDVDRVVYTLAKTRTRAEYDEARRTIEQDGSAAAKASLRAINTRMTKLGRGFVFADYALLAAGGTRCGHYDQSMSESLNSVLSAARSGSVLDVLVEWRRTTSRWWHERRAELAAQADAADGTLPRFVPEVHNDLVVALREATPGYVIPGAVTAESFSGETIFDGEGTSLVRIGITDTRATCTCSEPQLHLRLCKHVVAVWNGMSPAVPGLAARTLHDYVHPCWTYESLTAIYANTPAAEENWDADAACDGTLPWVTNRPTGRPSKKEAKRMRNEYADREKSAQTRRCSRCGAPGHYAFRDGKQLCKAPLREDRLAELADLSAQRAERVSGRKRSLAEMDADADATVDAEAADADAEAADANAEAAAAAEHAAFVAAVQAAADGDGDVDALFPVSLHAEPNRKVRMAECGFAAANWVLAVRGVPPVPYSVFWSIQKDVAEAEAAVLDDVAQGDEQLVPGGFFSLSCMCALFAQTAGEEPELHAVGSGRIPCDVRALLLHTTHPSDHWACALRDRGGGWVLKDTQQPLSRCATLTEVKRAVGTGCSVYTLRLPEVGGVPEIDVRRAPVPVEDDDDDNDDDDDDNDEEEEEEVEEDESSSSAAPAKKPAPKKPEAKKTTPKKPAPKKPAQKKPTPKMPAPKKPAPKKATPKKPAPKKPAPKKTTPKKPAAKKPAPKKPAAKKTTPKKPAAKKRK